VTHEYPQHTVLLDTWIIRRFRGAPRGLDGQALRWCPRRELASAGLLPADVPIVAALRLPERLIESETEAYVVVAAPSRRSGVVWAVDDRLVGASCRDAAEAAAAAAAGAAFIALRRKLPDQELLGLCAALPIPVYARGLALEDAWTLGASGVDQTPDASC
jgi:hypothetical protein